MTACWTGCRHVPPSGEFLEVSGGASSARLISRKTVLWRCVAKMVIMKLLEYFKHQLFQLPTKSAGEKNSCVNNVPNDTGYERTFVWTRRNWGGFAARIRQVLCIDNSDSAPNPAANSGSERKSTQLCYVSRIENAALPYTPGGATGQWQFQRYHFMPSLTWTMLTQDVNVHWRTVISALDWKARIFSLILGEVDPCWLFYPNGQNNKYPLMQRHQPTPAWMLFARANALNLFHSPGRNFAFIAV